MKRFNNNLRDWLEEGAARLPKGENGADACLNNPTFLNFFMTLNSTLRIFPRQKSNMNSAHSPCMILGQ